MSLVIQKWFDEDMSVSALTAYTLNAGAGSYTLTGASAALLATRLLKANVGSHTLSGAPAALLHGYKLNAAAGAYSVSGVAASLLAARLAKANTGSYTISGAAAKTLKGSLLPGSAGAYSLTGFAATLTSSHANAYVLAADPGAYALAGQATQLVVTSPPLLQPAPEASFSPRMKVWVPSVEVVRGRDYALAAQPGFYRVAGKPAHLRIDNPKKRRALVALAQ